MYVSAEARISTQGNRAQTHREIPVALLSRRKQTDDPEFRAPHVALPRRLGPPESDRRTERDTALAVAIAFVDPEDSRRALRQSGGSRRHRE